ncbi:MAG: YjbQ family protein [Deltaproteobacteria bacterium]|nr:MAG: YjbQ family protein [Deltaproteobacteria bacterium]
MLTTLQVKSSQRSEMIDVTGQVQTVVSKSGIKDGICYLYVPHTTGAITINEGADPNVVVDILTTLDRLIPWRNNYRHMEGNAAAHIKTSLMGSSERIFIDNGELVLGTWQRIFFCEFDGPRTRKLHVKVASL